jgi:hypothetical protein
MSDSEMMMNINIDLRKGREHTEEVIKLAIAFLEDDPETKCRFSWYMPYNDERYEFADNATKEHINKWWQSVDKSIDWDLYGEGQSYEED